MKHYSFVCGGGHEHGPFHSLEAAQSVRRNLHDDPDCGGKAGMVRSFEPRGIRFPTPAPGCVDIPGHFNESLGMYVRSGRHLRDIQKTEGCQDYQPVARTNNLVEEHLAKKRRKSRRRVA